MTTQTLSRPLWCIAHRGGFHPTATENTLIAFSHAIELGVDAIELDVWDIGGELLVFHDDKLGKLLPGRGRLIDHSPEYLRSLRLPCGQQVPTLQEVLKLISDRVELNIELKGPNCALRVAEVLESYIRDCQGNWDQYICSSFDYSQLWQMRQRLPQLRRGVLIDRSSRGCFSVCRDLGAYSLHPSTRSLNRNLVEIAHQGGLKVWVYTINQTAEFISAAALGVDGVFTDRPETLLRLNQQWRNFGGGGH